MTCIQKNKSIVIFILNTFSCQKCDLIFIFMSYGKMNNNQSPVVLNLLN